MNTERVHAEPRLLSLLARIDGCEAPITQRRADTMLARIAWSRIAEPGDGVAGALSALIGAEAALGLLIQDAGPEHLQRKVKAALEDDSRSEISGPSLRALTEAIDRWKPRVQRSDTVLDIERAVTSGLRTVFPGDPAWPTMLDDLGAHAPNMLWVRGDLECLRAASVGVVGARAATGYGSHVTVELVDGICATGLAIVSGAAYGIDAVAHRTALAAGAPTIAVVAGGADRPYPRAHESLLDRISRAGAVCSEMVPDAAPTKWRFLQRNRLIASLSQATLVTEAGVNSGSLNTAGHASQLGRQLGAVPGPITSAASAGCHRLIRDYDAMLITSARQACELAGVDESPTLFGSHDNEGFDESSTGPARDSAPVRRVCDALPLRGFRDLLAIAKISGLSPAQVRGVLAELELLGRVRRRESASGGETQWGLAK